MTQHYINAHQLTSKKDFDFKVNVIIPVKHRDDYNICDRLRMKSKLNIPANFEFIVIDFGSDSSSATKIKEICRDINFTYEHVVTKSNSWNASAARNIGLNHSICDYVLFEDVDLLHSIDFYERINIEIVNLIENGDWPFFVIPVTYLTKEGSEIAQGGINYELQSKLISEAYKEKSEYIVHHAPASSFMLCKYQDAIAIGGYDESFEGWGFEDSDFWLRLLCNTQIEKPRDFFRLDTRNYSKQVNWRGWRSLFRIFADIIANKGICSYHIWHPIAEHRSTSVRERNHKIFLSNTERYSQKDYIFTPLANPHNKKQLFLSKNPHSYNKDVFNFFPNPILIEEKYINECNLEELISKNNIESIVFNNPYGNQKRLSIYKKAKELNIKSYVIERGSLPNSIYIDENGFCCESSSYAEGNWLHKKMASTTKEKTLNYINEIKTSGITLEPQNKMIGGMNLKRKLFGYSSEIKILFVALQSPSDTTTRYFCGDILNYDNFLDEIKKLSHLLPDNWKVVVKNHPLSLGKFQADNITLVDDYHIGDILECCDAVALLNSGVGILSQFYEKHVFAFGQAHYMAKGLNTNVKTAKELVDIITSGKFSFDHNKSLKFISFLINDFYSFATWDRKERKHTEKANLSISINIKYSIVRMANKSEKIIKTKPFINLKESMLFDRYRFDDYFSRKEQSVINENKPTSITTISNVPTQKTKHVVNGQKKSPSSFSSKIKKLQKKPLAFFKDAIIKII